ncbi:MAG: ADP-ribosylglycohydrolase family protein, partial [Actinobacteria bacterium]|nr:ADP-ribosylglycohydrolase family protein [Actinomycetota bacterium]
MEYISDLERELGMTQEPWGLVLGELDQAAQTGRLVEDLRARAAALAPGDTDELGRIYEEILERPAPATWPHFESSDVAEIVAALPTDGPTVACRDLADRIGGAWVARIAGNMMGKPFEIGPTRDSIREYLTAQDAYPLQGYVPFPDGADRGALGMWGYEGVTEGRIEGAVRDDDIDYTVLALHLVETYGPRYTTRDVAVEWLTRLPVYQVFTAERNTYQNLVREVPLEEAGEYHNPFREWIGALIRADLFGFIYPGRPRAAALATLPDALLSHRANGIYGEMWAAALVSTAFTATRPEASIVESLRH